MAQCPKEQRFLFSRKTFHYPFTPLALVVGWVSPVGYGGGPGKAPGGCWPAVTSFIPLQCSASLMLTLYPQCLNILGCKQVGALPCWGQASLILLSI